MPCVLWTCFQMGECFGKCHSDSWLCYITLFCILGWTTWICCRYNTIKYGIYYSKILAGNSSYMIFTWRCSIVWECIFAGLSFVGDKEVTDAVFDCTDGAKAPFHLGPGVLVDFGKHTSNWKSVVDFPEGCSSPTRSPAAPRGEVMASLFGLPLSQSGWTFCSQLVTGVESGCWVPSLTSCSQSQDWESAQDLFPGPLPVRPCLGSCQTLFSGPRTSPFFLFCF